MDAYTIATNTVLTYDGTLRVGVSNLRPAEYVDADGVTRQGMTALLSLWRLDSPAAPQRVRAHPGQVVPFDGYQIEVLEIGQQRGTPVVWVALSVNGAGP